ncbi:uncharacterized protein LOC121387437 isoform X3 [Gigantopelta aegis]|uniref:uncharacterized protein LOC121387437 isoform X3 n=1 Tax=Gigantopelta aegis TaxID=1735272 RepID=UPI001B88D3ED|nr:uncharacterized protein LOC121387437 isoform X3 [Gigantopelta aegis]
MMSRGMQMDAEDEGGADFRADLLSIDGDLHVEDINTLKFLIQDFAPSKKLETINTGHELFDYLQMSGRLNEQNKWVLAEMLKRILRLDLLDTFKVDEKDLDQYLAKFGSHFTRYRLLLLRLAVDIGVDDLKRLLFCSTDIPRSKREKIATAMDFFTFFEQSKKLSPDNVDLLEDSLHHIGRCDLSQVVTDYKQSSLTNYSNNFPTGAPGNYVCGTKPAYQSAKFNPPASQAPVTGLPYKPAGPPARPAPVTGQQAEFSKPPALSHTGQAVPDPGSRSQPYDEQTPEQDAQDTLMAQQSDRIDVDPEPEPVPYYKMDAVPRGICIIINNRDFKQDPDDPDSKALPSREGTDVDAKNLQDTFQRLQFIVKCHTNLTDKGMTDLASQVSLEDHSAFDCFVCCILSHGVEGKLYGTNGRLLSITDLTGPFKSQTCSSLAGKPKLFFIQACQGTEEQCGKTF